MEEEEPAETDPAVIAADQEAKLREVTRYLRTHHLYCFWCGHAYGDEADMKAACPGDTRDAHLE